MQFKLLTPVLVAALLFTSPSIAQKRGTRAPSQHPDSRWYVFVSPDGDFTISFPERPNREADATGPNSVIQNYGLYTKNRMRFSINFQRSAGDPNSAANNEWNDDYEKAILAKDREEKRRVVNTRRIGKNIFEEEIWDSSSESGESINYLMQTILRQGRIYTLLCGSEIYGQPLNRSVCRRFLDSFHFTKDH